MNPVNPFARNGLFFATGKGRIGARLSQEFFHRLPVMQL
jgi:hypothetical protein